VGLLAARRSLMDDLVELLIREETIEGEAFREVVARSASAVDAAGTLDPTGKADVEAAQVGV